MVSVWEIKFILDKNRLPTLEEIETLTSYLPRLYAEGFSPIESWSGGKGTLPYPKYDPLVDEFFRHVAGDGWLDYDYKPEQASEMLGDENKVKTASLEQIKTMLTFCIRGERFSDGHWGEMIEKGYIRRILERLNEIKLELLK